MHQGKYITVQKQYHIREKFHFNFSYCQLIYILFINVMLSNTETWTLIYSNETNWDEFWYLPNLHTNFYIVDHIMITGNSKFSNSFLIIFIKYAERIRENIVTKRQEWICLNIFDFIPHCQILLHVKTEKSILLFQNEIV